MKKMNLHILGLILCLCSCTNRETTVDKDTLLGIDYRLFQETPAWELAKAVDDGDTQKIKEEIGKNKNLINFREERLGQTLLMLAVENLNYTSVETLLQLGADPNLQDFTYGESPVMRAANIETAGSQPDSRFLKILLKYGGDPNAEEHGKRKTRNTPLMIACLRGHIEYIKILIDAGAKADFVNEYGDTPLDQATTRISLNGDPEIVLYLISKGVDYHRVLYTTIEGEKKYLTDAMREWRFDLGSEKYKKKMQLVDFLKKNGMDYRKTKIPEEFLSDYPKDYLEKY